MPSIIESRQTGPDNHNGVVLRDAEGQLTVEAATIADFLFHADFSEILESSVFDAHAKKVQLGETEIEAVPGYLVARLVDKDDLYEMFLNHLDSLGDETLEEKAVLAVWESFFGGAPASDDADETDLIELYAEIDDDDELDENAKQKAKMAAKKAAKKAGKILKGAHVANGKMKKGGLKSLANAKKGTPQRDTAVRMILAMLNKGIAARKDGGGIKINKSKSKKGGSAAGKAKAAKFKKAAGLGEGEEVVWGMGLPLNSLYHVASSTIDEADLEAEVAEVAAMVEAGKDMEEYEDELEEKKKKAKAKAKAKKDADESDDDDDEDDIDEKKKKKDKYGRKHESYNGDASLVEGAKLAGSVLKLSQPKSING